MIKLHYSQGSVLIYDADDWAKLRKTHRILALPLKLLPEEVLLLLDKKLAKLVDCQFNITSEMREKFEKFENDLLEEEKIKYKNNRKRQLESMMGDIVAAKRKRGDSRPPEEIFIEELEKSCKITRDIMIWPTFLTPLSMENETEVSRDEICKSTNELKYNVFRDLWEQGYYITTGVKFGADFLVYLGDPIAYHAIFIVHCVGNPDEVLHSSEIVAFGRLATAVKKRAVLATSKNEKISYITINWIDA
ncbi:probable tRNA-splicing endonuclease subunit sen34 isoform X2 [Tribolium madens]|uniref:probable tRNA-splicing endonuclease subunit sen34 isoform X2 n=1 Tax=Tribolium madens TaxID=41895 RepID=UPI001CF74A23|nr:probable tRNA-splicing endonuclease subunit sen34 isoform X2 [Tribolium madens]